MHMYFHVHVHVHCTFLQGSSFGEFLVYNHALCVTVHTCPGAKVRVITREARYYAKTRAFVSFYAIISRAHAARAVT